MGAHDEEFLSRKVGFLVSRADAHDSKSKDDSTNRHRLCSATLTRDAGAIAAYLRDTQAASRYLRRAGKSFADAGHFSGFSLLETCGVGLGCNWLREHYGQEQPVRQILRALEEKADEKGPHTLAHRGADLFKSWSSTQQLLSLYHVSRASNDLDESGLLRERLSEVRTSSVGDFGISLWEYFDLVDVAATPGREQRLDGKADEAFYEIMRSRSRALRIAQEDSWHWNRILSPAALIDMNLLALSTMMLRRSGSTEAFDRIAEPFVERQPLVSLPMSLARLFVNEGSIGEV